jgi:hypothetical protein
MRIAFRRWSPGPSPIVPFVVVFVLATIGPEAKAQGGDSVSSPEFRKNLCSDAASTLRRRPTTTSADAIGHFKRALTEIQSCPDDGPATLELLWQNPMRDSSSLALLQGVTGHLRDRRLLDVVSRIASDPSRPVDVRLAAIGTLVTYYDSSLTASFPDRGAAATRPRDYVLLGSQTHPVVTRGREPLAGTDTRRSILGVLTTLAQSDAYVRIRNSAQYLATYFQRGW